MPFCRRWLSPKEVANKIGCHPQTIYDYIARELLPAARLGRRVLIDWPKVEEKLEAQAKGKEK
jgi:excisionase family DNA binding protein